MSDDRPASPAAALVARGLGVRLGGQAVLHDVSATLARGRWIAVAGPNGAGKTTLLKALARLLPAGAVVTGEVELLGRPQREWPARERARALAWLGQGEPVGELSAFEVVMLGRLPHRAWLAAPSPADEAAAERAMRRTRCWEARGRTLDRLSAGERQRVLLARALAVEADVLLMDEPLQALDLPHQADWAETVRALVRSGCTVVSVLHELSVALDADELLLMREGRLAWHGRATDAATHRALAAVFDGGIEVHEVAGRRVALPR